MQIENDKSLFIFESTLSYLQQARLGLVAQLGKVQPQPLEPRYLLNGLCYYMTYWFGSQIKNSQLEPFELSAGDCVYLQSLNSYEQGHVVLGILSRETGLCVTIDGTFTFPKPDVYVSWMTEKILKLNYP